MCPRCPRFIFLHEILSYSWELLQTTEMTWHWAMWLYCCSRSGHGERTSSWKPSVRSASRVISSMRTSSAMLQVSFVWINHKTIILCEPLSVQILLLLSVGKEEWGFKMVPWQLLGESQWRFKDRVQGIGSVVLAKFKKAAKMLTVRIAYRYLASPGQLV